MSLLPERTPSWMQPQSPAEQRMNFRLTGYWNDLRGTEDYARITDFNVETIPGFGQHAFMLDLHDDSVDPMIRFTGQHLAMECGKNVTGQRLSAVPMGSLLAKVARKFAQVVENEAPCEFEEELDKFDGGQILYRGIMLPFSKDGTAVDYIVGAITSKTINKDGETVERAPLMEAQSDPLAEIQAQDSRDSQDSQGQAYASQDEEGARGLIALVESEINADVAQADDQAAAHADDLADDLTSDPADDPAENRAGGQGRLRDSLDECQSYARKISAAESRSRKALYDALERVYAFYHEAAADPEAFEAMVADAGLTMQERAPFTPVVKLVFGADYDKTRLSEYAASLGYAKRMNQDTASFRSFVESQAGGLKACVRAERAARRAERGSATDATEEARRLMREMEALGLITEKAPGDAEFAVLLGRRSASQPGVIEVLTVFDDKPAAIDSLLRRAAKQARVSEPNAERDDADSQSSELG